MQAADKNIVSKRVHYSGIFSTTIGILSWHDSVYGNMQCHVFLYKLGYIANEKCEGKVQVQYDVRTHDLLAGRFWRKS